MLRVCATPGGWYNWKYASASENISESVCVCARACLCVVGTVPVSDCVPVNEHDVCTGIGVRGAVYWAT